MISAITPGPFGRREPLDGHNGTEPLHKWPNSTETPFPDEALETIIKRTIKKKETDINTPDSPFYIGDMSKIREQYAKWESYLPDIDVFYAVKCCSELPVLRQLVDLNSSFDCASQREVETVLSLGVDPSRIIFANTIKSVSSLKYAAKHNVDLMTFDNEFELDKIKTYSPNARLVLRIRCQHSEKTVLNFGIKFGCPMKKVNQLLNKARSAQLTVVGVSFHCGCLISDAGPLTRAIQDAYEVFQMGKRAGFNFSLLDIGGGWYGHDAPDVTFDKMAGDLKSALDAYFPAKSGVRIIAEPGTFIVTSAFTWNVKVIGKASDEEMEEGYVMEDGRPVVVRPRFVYYVNDGYYGSMTLNIQKLPQMKPLSGQGINHEETYPSVIFGPTCDPIDVVYSDIQLPELREGDWLYLEDAGAYSIAVASNFNMMDKAQCFYIHE